MCGSRRWAGFTVLVVMLVAAAVASGSARAGTQTGLTAEPYSAFNAESAGGAVTGQKPESKLWYNDLHWWASMISNAQGGKHTIHRLDGTTWTDTAVVVDSRVTAREDVLEANGKLYILVRAAPGTGSSKLARFTYSNSKYTMDSGFPVDVAGGGSETETLARDTTGKLWLTYTNNNNVYVTHSTTSDSTWRSAYVLSTATGLSSDDISAIVSFDDGNGAAVGVMWSNQSDNKQHFAVHRDSKSDTTWTQETALSGLNQVDDHINLKVYSGRVYAAVKTGQDDLSGTGTKDLIKLLVRSTSGTWANYRVATVSEDNTRPITLLEIDPVDHKIYVFMSMGVGPTAHGISYKQTLTTNINFPTAPTVFIEGANGEVINDATTAKENATNTTGVVVMASDGQRYWWNQLDAGTSTTAPPTAVAGNATTTKDTATTLTFKGTDADAADCNLTFTIATPPAHGTLGAITNQACVSGAPNSDTATVQYTPAAGYVGPDSVTFKVSDGTASATAAITITVNDTPPPPGSVAFRSASSAGNATETSLTIPAPAGVQPGDVELGVVSVRGGPRVTAPVGWSLVRSDANGNTMKQVVYSHVVGSSEPTSYTWSWSSAQGAAGGIVAYDNVDTANPINASGGQTSSGTSIVTAPSITTTVAGAMLVGFFGTAVPATTIAAVPMTERFDVSSSAGSYRVASEGAEQWLPLAGATGVRAATASLTADNVGQLVALNPGSGTPPPVNAAPVATPGSASITKDTAAAVTLAGTDADAGNCELAFSITAQPTHGTLGAISDQACVSGTPNADSATVLYTPTAGYTGADSFTFQVSDGTATATAAFTLTINSTPPPPGSIAFHGSSSAGNATANTLAITAPSGAVAGDVELAVVDVRGSPAVTPPAGWTLVRSDQDGFSVKQDVYWHLVGSTEPASYTWTFGSSQGASGGISAYSGVDTANPVNVSGGQIGSGTTITAPAVTTTVANAMLVGFFGTTNAATVTQPAGMSERFDVFATAGTYRAASESADQLLGAAGATGSRSAVSSLSGGNIGQLVALKPA